MVTDVILGIVYMWDAHRQDGKKFILVRVNLLDTKWITNRPVWSVYFLGMGIKESLSDQTSIPQPDGLQDQSRLYKL